MDNAIYELERLSVGLTGARKGDILIGTHAGTRGAVLRVNADIYPSRNILDRVEPFPTVYSQFLIKLGGIEFFSAQTEEERKTWLNNSVVNNDFFPDESVVELLQPGEGDARRKQGSIFTSYLPEEELNTIMSGPVTVKEINDTVVQYTGKSSTLVFLKTFWRVNTAHQMRDSWDGPVLDVERGRLLRGVERVLPTQRLYVSAPWAFLVEKEEVRLESIVVDEFFSTYTRNFTAAAYKSLLQKIVRLRPRQVQIGSMLIPAEKVLVWTFHTLVKHPGAFVPNIQRFVGGLESATKRLAIAIYEDSSLPEKEEWRLLSLLSGALLSQRVREWRPSPALLQTWLETLLLAYNTGRAYDTDYRDEAEGEPFTIRCGQPLLETCSAVLDELRSFPTDLGLARGWARRRSVVGHDRQPEVMPLQHCVDQHWLPSFIYYLDPRYIEPGVANAEPFEPLFKKVWREVSAMNPRRSFYDENFEQKPFVKAIRKAQTMALFALQDTPQQRLFSEDLYLVRYELPDAWIAALVGVLKVRVKGARAFVTLKTSDPLTLVAIREPVIRGKYEALSPEQEEEAIAKGTELLQRSVLLNQAVVPHESLKNCRARLISTEDESYYVIEGPQRSERWSKVRQLEMALPIQIDAEKRTTTYALSHTGNGLEEHFSSRVLNLVQKQRPAVIRRLLVYLAAVKERIEMARLSREGGSTTTNCVELDDVEVFSVLLQMSIILPGVLEPDGVGALKVKNGPLLWVLRDQIRQSLLVEGEKSWPCRFSDTERQPYEYQVRALQEMISNHENGLRGNFLWLSLGSGKTFLVLSYLAWLRDKERLPRYVVYTLPPESIRSIIAEIRYFDVPIHMVIPLKSAKKKGQQYEQMNISVSTTFKPFHINLVAHDHLRLCGRELSLLAEQTITVFDEVHLFLNQTLRTGTGMNVARLCREFIALTGTPIVDNKMEKLITWLEHIVPVEVNRKNFWVAANNMIAKDINTGLRTESSNVQASFQEEERQHYQKLVPPHLGGQNRNPTATDWLKAVNVCYEACDREMIRLCLECLAQNRRVMLVGRNAEHVATLEALLKKRKVGPIFTIQNERSIFHTDESVAKGEPDYKVVIVPKNRSQGYTLTRLNVMITSVYPSNSATREQLRGRINRIGQKVQPLLYYTVHIGILTLILQNHDHASNLVQALRAIAMEKV